MTRQLEDWELDLLADGLGTAEQRAALDNNPHNQQKLTVARQEMSRAQRFFFRATCPSSEVLGDYAAGDVRGAQQLKISTHLQACPHCQREMKLFAIDLPIPANSFPQAQRASGLGALGAALQRLVLKLQESPDAALRGEADWSGVYGSGEYMLALTQRRAKGGFVLEGSLFLPEENDVAGSEALLTLKQDNQVQQSVILSSTATFSFDRVKAGRYELIVSTPVAELVIPEITF